MRELWGKAAHGRSIGGLAFAPQDMQILSVSHDRTVKVWSASSGEKRTFTETGAVESWR